VCLGVSRTGTPPAHVSLLLLYSVYDGRVLHTQRLAGEAALDRAALRWTALDAQEPVSQALRMLTLLAPLAPLEDPTKPAAPTGLFGAQAARLAQRNSDTRPSSGISQGRGVLAHIPSLLQCPVEAGWRMRETASAAPAAETPSKRTPALLYCIDGAGLLHVLLDGTIALGVVDMAHGAVSLEATTASVSSICTDNDSYTLVHVPLEPPTAAVHHLAALSTALQFHFAHALDAAHYAAKAWLSLVRPRAAEWHTQLEDVAGRHGVDIVLELCALVTTGRASEAAEQLLLHNLTEGATISMETDAKRGLKLVRRFAGTAIVPACERALILITELQGCAAWIERYGALLHVADTARLATAACKVQTCLAVGIVLQECAERELLALDEFFKWWRMEQDRQERLKVEAVAPPVITYHDTLTVLEQLQRGFLSPELDALLGAPDDGAPARAAAPAPPDTSDVSHEAVPPLIDPVEVCFEGGLAEGCGGSSSDAPRAARDADVLSALDAALEWLDTPREAATSAPTDAQVRGVYATPQLFAGPAYMYTGPRLLPGDKRTLVQRLEDVCEDTASVLSAALGRAAVATPQTSSLAVPHDVLLRDEALRSAPGDVAERMAPLVRTAADAPSQPGGTASAHVHAWARHLEGDAWIDVMRDTGAVGAVSIPRSAVLDVAFRSATCLIVLYRDEHGAALGAVDVGAALRGNRASTDPAFRTIMRLDVRNAHDEPVQPARLALFSHGTGVVLSTDAKTMTYVDARLYS